MNVKGVAKRLLKSRRRAWSLANPVLKHFRSHRVVMIHPGRCGSTVLSHMLAAHPRLHWGGEIFSPEVLRKKWENLEEVERARVILNAEAMSGPCGFGFEALYFQLELMGVSLPEFISEVRKLHYNRFIILSRRNLLRRAVSNHVAKESGRYHFRLGEKPSLVRIEIDPGKIVGMLEHQNALLSRVRTVLADSRPLELVYEEDVEEDPCVGYRKIVEYLDLKRVAVRPDLRRATPYPLEQVLGNFPAIAEALTGTRFEWMLHDSPMDG